MLFKNVLASQFVRKDPEFDQSYHTSVIFCGVVFVDYALQS